MNYKTPKAWAVLIVMCVVGVVAILTWNSNGVKSAMKNKEENRSLDVYQNPLRTYSSGLNLIFFADGYLSFKEFDYDIQVLLQQLRSIEPWKSYDSYSIYKVRPNELDICTVKTENERKPTLRCDAEKINSYLNQLKTDRFKLIVLSRRNFQSWANVSRLSDSGIFFSIPKSPRDETEKGTLGILFAHMMGHAFGLKDEEVFVIAKADSAAHKPDGPNCAPNKETAEKWWGDLVGKDAKVGYFPGCASKAEYIKPTKGSLMNLNELEFLTDSYGPVSERYLRKILDYCFSEKQYSISDDPEFFALYPEFRECVTQ